MKPRFLTEPADLWWEMSLLRYVELRNLSTEGRERLKIGTDIHTGNFNKETIDVADVLKFNENLSELGGTQGGKVIHEIREQYSKQVLGETIFSTAHRQAIQSENNVNLSVRKDSGGGRTAIQSYSARGNTVRNEIIYNNRRVIKVKKQ